MFCVFINTVFDAEILCSKNTTKIYINKDLTKNINGLRVAKYYWLLSY